MQFRVDLSMYIQLKGKRGDYCYKNEANLNHST